MKFCKRFLSIALLLCFLVSLTLSPVSAATGTLGTPPLATLPALPFPRRLKHTIPKARMTTIPSPL